MNPAGSLRKSTIWAAIEVVVSGVGLFVILKIILTKLGTEALGIWSLVLSTTILLRVGDASISAVVPSFIGKAYADGRYDDVRQISDTALVSSLALHTGVAIALYYPLLFAIKKAVPTHAEPEALRLLPLAILAFVALSVAQTALATVIGLHRAYAKSAMTVVAIPLQLLIVWVSIDRLGLAAAVFAQLCQSLLMIFAARFYTAHVIGRKLFSAFLLHWRTTRFREIYGIGLKMQLAQVASLTFDPFLKFVLSASFGLHAVAYYEIGNRVASQVRQLVVSPTQALLPVFAATRTSNPQLFAEHYATTMSNLIFFAGLITVGVVIASPAISIVMVGMLDPQLIAMVIVATAGWMVNSLAAPAFQAAISADFTRWNILGQGFATLTAPIAVSLLAGFGSAPLSVAGGMCALAIGALMMIRFNCAYLGLKPWPGRHQFMTSLRRLTRGGSYNGRGS